MQVKKYFYCYSCPMKEFFVENECEVIMFSKNIHTNKTFWVFENGEKITKLLEQWRLCKK